MDSEDVTLDWGANEDDEVLTPPIKNDAATMSGAESLLALASGSGKTGDKDTGNDGNTISDDKDSDVVSLGGDDNDMDELHAYQSRTHLGGMPANEVKSAQSAKRLPRRESATDKTSLSERPPSPLPSVVVAASPQSPDPPSYRHNNASPLSNNITIFGDPKSNGSRMDDTVSTGKSKSRSGSHSESARPFSLANSLPPPGTHGLPPKPIAAALTAPFVRPSHPSIMSASTMRERELDLRRAASPKRGGGGGSRPYSPEGDIPLSPGWETRLARDSNDPYYYNVKTNQSAWTRQEAAGLIPRSQPSPSYYYSFLPGQRPRTPDHDTGRRGRSSRYELSSDRALSPRLSFDDRHYSPPKPSTGPPPSSRGDYPQHPRRGGGGHGHQRASPPEITSPRSIPRRGNGRDILSGSNRIRVREDKPPPYIEEMSVGRASEKVIIGRERSRSPGRERYDSRRISPKEGRPDLVSGSYDDRDSKDRTGPPSRYHTGMPSQLPPLSPQIKQSYPPDRYIVPSPDTFRPWGHSPQASAPERPPKRMRSPRSPIRHEDYRSLPSQPLITRWGPEYDGNRARNEINPLRDRPSPTSEPPLLIPSAKYMEREERRGRDSDAKRQKITDDLDSAPARRPLPADVDVHDTRNNGRPYGRPQPRADGPTVGAPVGPRRRDNLPPRGRVDTYLPPDVRSRNDPQDAQPERRFRGLDRERESSRSDLPTGPRAMEFPPIEPDLNRHHGPPNHGYQRSVPNRAPPAEHVLSNIGGPGNRGSNQPPPPPPLEDTRHRQRDRNNNRQDDRPRGNGEGRYAPSANNNNPRYDSPPLYSPGSNFNNLSNKSRIGDFYRPNERMENNNNRDRIIAPPPRDGKRIDVGQERYRPPPPVVEERPRAVFDNPHGRSRSPVPVVNHSDSFTNDANTVEIQPKNKENVQMSESRHVESKAQSPSHSRRKGQRTERQAEGLPRMAGDRDRMIVEETTKADTTPAPVNNMSETSMEVESKIPPPPISLSPGNTRRRQNRLSNASRSEPANGDRPVHHLPAKPSLRQSSSSSLLDRLSDGPTKVNQTSPPTLRDRVGAVESSSSKSPQKGPSLRDRLDKGVERKNEGKQQQQRPGNHSWKNNRSRKGRGQ